ncbi:MAG: ATP-binding protein [Oscillochloris sp.]|nr:ATP-binding protein [Oscillochloris sp.]
MSLQHPEVIRLDLPARYTYLHILSDCIADMLRQIDGIEDHETLTYNMQLAAHEACTNIVGHAYEGVTTGDERIIISLALLPHPRRLEIELRDTGKPFNPEIVPSPSLNEAQVHGYGLFLMRNLMDTVTYKAQPGDNYWCLVKNL